MRQRCLDPGHISYPLYGGRGLAICKRWDRFENFLADMGRKPSSQHSLGRRNNGRGYTPANCRWETRAEQARNRMTNKFLTVDGVTMTLVEWSIKTGVKQVTIESRLRKGWPTKQVIEKKNFRDYVSNRSGNPYGW
jgi:hypothetical protein